MTGGGVAGTVDFPDYMKNFHKTWMQAGSDTNMGPGAGTYLSELMRDAIAADTPYTGESAYDPDADLAAVQSRLSTWISNVDAFDSETDWLSALTQARANVGTATFPLANVFDMLESTVFTEIATNAGVLVSSTLVSNRVSAFTTRTAAQWQTQVAQFVGQMADLNAVMTSSYVWGLAFMHSQRQAEINDYQRSIEQQLYDSATQLMLQAQMSTGAQRVLTRDQTMLQGTERMMNDRLAGQELVGRTAALKADSLRVQIVAKQEQLARNLQIDVDDADWDFRILQHGANFLASINGAPVIPKPPSQFQTALSGAVGGAATGAAIGSVVPGIGTAVGAGVGAAIGLIGSF